MENIKPENRLKLKEILSFLMEECDIDDAKLARETGIPASTISRMRINENANPTVSTLIPLSKFFSISINQLIGDAPLPMDRLPGTDNASYYTSALLPIIEWDLVIRWISSGNKNLGKKFISWISTEKEVSSNSFALIIPTDSLGLAFRKGSVIMVDPALTPKDGDLILTEDEKKQSLLLKQFLVDGNDAYLRSVNPEFKNTVKLNKNHKIIGIVIETRFSSPISSHSERKKGRKFLPGFVKSIIPKLT